MILDEMCFLHLIDAHCKPLLLYGCEAVTVLKSDVSQLEVAWSTAYYKNFNVSAVNAKAVQFRLG